MKSILISIRPEWVDKILNGEKTIEIRKRFPKDYVGWVYIYVTKNRKKGLVRHIKCACNDYGWDEDFVEFEEIPIDEVWTGCELNGKVVARFWCDKVEVFYGGAYVIHNSLNYSFEDLKKDVLDNAPKEDKETELKELEWYEQFLKDTQLTREELRKYVGYKDFSAIHITKLEIFEKPKEISEFRHAHCDNLKNVNVVHNLIYDDYVFQYFDNERCRKCNHYDSDCNDCLKDFKPLNRAPQSWCYVEED